MAVMVVMALWRRLAVAAMAAMQVAAMAEAVMAVAVMAVTAMAVTSAAASLVVRVVHGDRTGGVIQSVKPSHSDTDEHSRSPLALGMHGASARGARCRHVDAAACTMYSNVTDKRKNVCRGRLVSYRHVDESMRCTLM